GLGPVSAPAAGFAPTAALLPPTTASFGGRTIVCPTISFSGANPGFASTMARQYFSSPYSSRAIEPSMSPLTIVYFLPPAIGFGAPGVVGVVGLAVPDLTASDLGVVPVAGVVPP